MQEYPFSKGRTSVARVVNDWYVVATSSELGKAPLRTTVYGIPYVLFRDSVGVAGALLDRCPHRNAPLSLGVVKQSVLECSYHGWQFDTTGRCVHVPAVSGSPGVKKGRVESFSLHEEDGFIWVYATPDTEPTREVFRFPLLREKKYTTIRATLDVHGSIHATAENALDVPHTAYLHGGLFRRSDGRKNEIEVKVNRLHDRVEAEYIGEPRPKGIAGKILSPGGGVVSHFDRFILPSIVQVEYHLGGSSHLCITAALTPVEDFRTRIFALMSFRTPLPDRLLALLLKPIIMRIFRQDEDMLRAQTETIQTFGGEQFQSTSADVLGPDILRLLRHAERGERIDDKPQEKESFRLFL
ncbi:MAG TPA: aromatic ring-hydroxylating dioxygenase subunit alpha [Bacteroidota bacterium]